MEILPLLRKRLKDDEMLDLLEWMDAEVIYDFDRLHENQPDVYWAKATDYGVTLRFDERQILATAFLYVQPSDGHKAADQSLFADIVFFDAESQVRTYAVDHDIQSTTGSRPLDFPPPGTWIRLDYAHHRVHYEFSAGLLSLITISSAEA